MAYYINSETGEMIDLPKTKKYIIDKFGNGRTINNNIDYEQYSTPFNIIEICYTNNEYLIKSTGTKDIIINEISLEQGQSATLIDGDNIVANQLNLIFRVGNDIQSENFNNYALQISKDSLNAIVLNDQINSRISLVNNRRQIVEDFNLYEIDNFKIEIIKNNFINALLKTDILRIGNKIRFYYEIEDKVSLYDYIKSNLFKDYETPIILFNIIVNLENIREYLLDYKDLNFKIQDIFISKDNLEIKHILSHNNFEAEDINDIYLSLITLINSLNELKPNNYLCPERSNILLMLSNNSSLEEISRAITNEEIQNKVDDTITNHRAEFRIKEQETKLGDESDKIENKFLKDINSNNIKKKIIFNKISKSKAIITGQIILLIIIGVIYLTSYLNTFDFIALLIIVSALDLWVLKINKFI
jgi:hypothetical protein